MSYADIARVVLLPAIGALSVLDYRVPPALRRDDLRGCRALLPLGRRRVLGVVCELVNHSDHAQLKDIEAIIDDVPVLDRSLLALCQWMADYYLAPLAEVVATALPGTLRVETERRIGLVTVAPDATMSERERVVIEGLRDGPQRVPTLARSLHLDAAELTRRIGTLRRKGWIEVSDTLRERAPTKHLRFYEVQPRSAATAEALLQRRPALAAVYRYLHDHPLRRSGLPELRASFPGVAAKLKQLVSAGIVRASEEEVYRVLDETTASPVPDRPVTVTSDQRDALASIAASEGFAAFLLWGVTGSGKTEVYLRAIAAALNAGRTALVLVPEISLTHQLVDRVRARFGPRVAVLHSALGVGERWDEWRRIARGEAAIVVGARSAVFAPLPRLGLIVVDEEHDASYKQDDGIRYHGRDVAVVRARLASCPVVLGSATPSMESFHNAQTGRYRLLELRERVESRALPDVEIVDLRRTGTKGSSGLSTALTAALQANFTARGQSLVFLNRRGFASVMQCQACGDAITCPNCCVALTYHRAWHALRCHHCDHTVREPRQCPGCGESALTAWGPGTEQIETALRTLLPGARVARMDRDTMTKKGAQRALLSAWASGKVDVLIGTQMITKGHDIPGVTLVGVVLADLSLNFPDFRAAERTFQLLTQVAGRAGRGDRAGRVIVQTLQPDHFSLRHAATHDFGAFAAEELEHRRELGYPPFARLALLRVEGEQLAAVERLAQSAAAQLRADSDRRLAVLGPAPAPIERIRGRHRWQVLCRASSGTTLRHRIGSVRDQLRPAARAAAVRLIVDVDPQSML